MNSKLAKQALESVLQYIEGQEQREANGSLGGWWPMLTDTRREVREALGIPPTQVTAADGHHDEHSDGCTCTRTVPWSNATLINPLCPIHGDVRETGVVCSCPHFVGGIRKWSEPDCPIHGAEAIR